MIFKEFKFPFRLFLYWLVLFNVLRGVFLLSYSILNSESSINGWLLSFGYGLRMDLSMMCYLSALPILIWFLCIWFKKDGIKKFIQIYLLVVSSIYFLIGMANIVLYPSWGTLLNVRALAFLQQPVEMMASVSAVQIILLLILITTAFYLNYRIIKNFLMSAFASHTLKIKIKPLLIRVIILCLIPIGIRGGIQQIPINESASYYSKNLVLNHAATNPAWYLMNNIWKSGNDDKNKFVYFNDLENKNNFIALFQPDSSEIILNTTRPNIVIIALESWTADIIEPLGGDTGVTPFFSSLCDSGLLFTNIYSSGTRTDQMFPSILSGYPAQPYHSIVRFANKTEKLPMLSSILSKEGYHSSFYYGGELGFANMKGFLLHGGINDLTGKDDFASEQMNSKWGANDEFVFRKQAKDLIKTKQPFFSMVLTLSTHEPFEIPIQPKFSGKSLPTLFKNAAYYTDTCLKEYFESIKNEPWYKNTLFILVADHGHILPRQREYYDMESHKIPLLLYGEVLKTQFKGVKVNSIGAQHDIASTILHQLRLTSSDFIFSNNLLNKKRFNFAYLNFDDATGWKNDKVNFVFSSTQNKIMTKYSSTTDKDSVQLNEAKHYLQFLYTNFKGL